MPEGETTKKSWINVSASQFSHRFCALLVVLAYCVVESIGGPLCDVCVYEYAHMSVVGMQGCTPSYFASTIREDDTMRAMHISIIYIYGACCTCQLCSCSCPSPILIALHNFLFQHNFEYAIHGRCIADRQTARVRCMFFFVLVNPMLAATCAVHVASRQCELNES